MFSSAKAIVMLHDLFDAMDTDGSGEIDAEEFLDAMHRMGKVEHVCASVFFPIMLS